MNKLFNLGCGNLFNHHFVSCKCWKLPFLYCFFFVQQTRLCHIFSFLFIIIKYIFCAMWFFLFVTMFVREKLMYEHTMWSNSSTIWNNQQHQALTTTTMQKKITWNFYNTTWNMAWIFQATNRRVLIHRWEKQLKPNKKKSKNYIQIMN